MGEIPNKQKDNGSYEHKNISKLFNENLLKYYCHLKDSETVSVSNTH